MKNPFFALFLFLSLLAQAQKAPDLVIPNFHLIEENSIYLLETNNKFIESFMVGMNHEMGRELMWNNYPTDQRGTYFARFWDSNAIIPTQAFIADVDDKEQLRTEFVANNHNINPIHEWESQSVLGSHNSGFASEQGNLVLVMRADLLKKFPNLNIYAIKASDWEPHPTEPDAFQRLIDFDNAVRKYPVYYGKMPPDAMLLGFDLDQTVAKGGEPSSGQSGWYFVLEERVSDIRFGLDILPSPGDFDYDIDSRWSGMSWQNTGVNNGTPNNISNMNYVDLEQLNTANNNYDGVFWGSNSSSMSYIFYQPGVRVAIHANDLI